MNIIKISYSVNKNWKDMNFPTKKLKNSINKDSIVQRTTVVLLYLSIHLIRHRKLN